MTDTPAHDDPYTIQAGGTREAPTTLRGRLRYLGPGIVVSGSIVGSGEILLTAGLGATVGFIMLWWVLFSCWIKSLIQAELARYVVTSGDTYLRALNRLPGTLPGPNGPISWPVWLGLIGFIPGLLGAGGIIGGAGQALGLLLPNVSGGAATGIAAVLVMLILWSGRYARIEKIMIVLVISFTISTVVSALLMQGTEYRATAADLASGMTFAFPLEHAVLALAMYGATGVAAGEIAAYTYWCIEKGYASFVGADREDPRWVARAQGWIAVVQTDVWVTLGILTCATLSFYWVRASCTGLASYPPALTRSRCYRKCTPRRLAPGPTDCSVSAHSAFFSRQCSRESAQDLDLSLTCSSRSGSSSDRTFPCADAGSPDT